MVRAFRKAAVKLRTAFDSLLALRHRLISSLKTLPARLSRVTSSGRFLPEIDGLRFIAIASVVLFHINGYFRDKSVFSSDITLSSDMVYRLFDLGNIGVQLFFVLSGFILGLPFAECYLSSGQRVSLKRYFIRRLTRLEPPYIANLFLLFMARVLLFGGALSLAPHLFASLFYLHNLLFDSWSQVNFVAWSLEIEVQFYILAPLLALFFRIRPTLLRRVVIVGIGLLAAWWQQLRFGAIFPHGLNVFDQLQFFLAGFLLADVYLVDWHSAPKRRLLWDFVGLLAWLGLIFVLHYKTSARFTTPIFIFLAYCGAFRGPIGNWIVSLRPLTIIGGMCYTIYLYHAYLILAILAITRDLVFFDTYGLNVLLQVLLITPPLILISTLFFVVLERPFMQRDWPRRLLQRARSR